MRANNITHCFSKLPGITALAAVLLFAACDVDKHLAEIEQRNIYGQELPRQRYAGPPPNAVRPGSIPKGLEDILPESKITDTTEMGGDNPGDLSIHPDGMSFVFDFGSYGETYLMSYEIVSARVKTLFRKKGVGARSPAYSPDGEWIAFVATISKPDGRVPPHVALIDKDGGNFKSLSMSEQGTVTSPSFSPDGQFVIYTKIRDVSGLEFYRINVATGKEEHILRIPKNIGDHIGDPVFFGSADEIVFIVGQNKLNENIKQDGPCQDSQSVPVRNPKNLRLCKLNLATGVSTTLYNKEIVEKIYSSRGQLPVYFRTGMTSVEKNSNEATPEAHHWFFLHDGQEITQVGESIGFGLAKRSIGLSPDGNISHAGEKVIYPKIVVNLKQRIADFDGTKPRVVVRDMRTGVEEERVLPIPNEAFAIYRAYVKPKQEKVSFQ